MSTKRRNAKLEVKTVWEGGSACSLCGQTNDEYDCDRVYEIKSEYGKICLCNDCARKLPAALKKWKRSDSDAKIVVTVTLPGENGEEITTLKVYDNRAGEAYNSEYIQERGIQSFADMNDLKESLNWNLYGDSSRFKFKKDKKNNVGYAYIFD